jgi:hypothetical protein
MPPPMTWGRPAMKVPPPPEMLEGDQHVVSLVRAIKLSAAVSSLTSFFRYRRAGVGLSGATS